MRSILRSILFTSVSLFIVSYLFNGITVHGGIQTYATGGAILAIISLILKPILQSMAFPITIITLGLFSFVINGLVLFALTKFYPKINVHAFHTPAIHYQQYGVPSFSLNLPLSFIFLAFMLSFFISLLKWITIKKEA